MNVIIDRFCNKQGRYNKINDMLVELSLLYSILKAFLTFILEENHPGF
jgi:hypothetical protein